MADRWLYLLLNQNNSPMKKLLVLLLILPLFGFAQNFTGEIIYETRIIPKSDEVELQQLIEEKQGNTSSYLITDRQYKTTIFEKGEFSYSYTYDSETKRMYDERAEQPYLTYRDATNANNESYSSQIYKDSTTNILGHEAYLTYQESEYGKSKSYLSSELKVNYEKFEGHEVGNWYNHLKAHDGAMTLRTITEYDTYFEVSEAVSVKKRKVKPKEFKLPNKPIAASFSVLDQNANLNEPTQNQIQCYQNKVRNASKSGGEQYRVYVTFLLEQDGTIRFIDTVEKDEGDLYKVAIDVIKNCGFSFVPGKIKEEAVASQVVFPIDFLR